MTEVKHLTILESKAVIYLFISYFKRSCLLEVTC